MDSVANKPLPAGLGFVKSLRWRLRNAFFRFLRKVAATDDAKAIQVSSIKSLLPRRSDIRGEDTLGMAAPPYSDLGTASSAEGSSQRSDVVIITARFRSGSTLLWNLFRMLKGCTAYYEPFNERRWFDPSARGCHTDPTHRGIAEYWREYDGLEELGRYYQESWISEDLLMDAQSWNPAMKRYIEIMIERAAGRPVLQFNRIDFRLGWFRHHFPRAKIVHLYRHPRDQWMSSLVDRTAFTRHGSMRGFGAHDHYYLLCWARDLKYHFPFLDEREIVHPYQMFYYIWKLSYLYGRRHAHLSLAYEDLLSRPERCLTELFGALSITGGKPADVVGLIETPRPSCWRSYASEEWFREHEGSCEAVLVDYFGATPACPESAVSAS
jgi:hypothetical protein